MNAISDVLDGNARWHVEHGDALSVLRSLPDNSLDAWVTDPPSGIGFMGRDWDKDKGGSENWIAWLSEIAREALRVLKPGAHAFVWAIPRTSHWTGTALERAGFDIVDQFSHLFGAGFPKSLNVSKAIDERDFRDWLKAHPAEMAFYKRTQRRKKELGGHAGHRLMNRVTAILKRRARMLREIVSSYTAGGNAGTPTDLKGGTYGVGVENSEAIELHVTRGATEKSRQWDGWHTALKPAHEVWWLVQKPFKGTIADNVLRYGTGGLNIDGCRVAGTESTARPSGGMLGILNDDGWEPQIGSITGGSNLGRFPANLLLSHSALCRKIGTREVKAHPSWGTPNRECESTFTGETVSQVRHGDVETETVDVFECHESCPIAEMDRQSGESSSPTKVGRGARQSGFAMGEQRDMPAPGDSGGASRFFNRFEWSELDDLTPFLYLPKPSRAERDAGLEHFRALTGGEATGREDDSAGTQSPRAGAGRKGGARNSHPTVKSVALMRHLCRLVTPPGGVVLDTFAGSGTTGIAAVLEGFRFVGIELNDTDAEPFVSLARARINHVIGGYVPEPKAAGSTERKPMPALGQLGLFERVA